MLSMLMLGLPICIALFIVRRNRLHALVRIPVLLGCLCWFVIDAFAMRSGVFLGSSNWWQNSPWRGLIMFALMLAGMEVRVLNSAIIIMRADNAKLKAQGKSQNARLKIDRWDLFQPAIFSLLTFSVLYGQIGNGALSVASISLSFETGFLWQTVVGKQITGSITE